MVQQFLAWAIRKNPLRHEKCIFYIYIYIYIERERERERDRFHLYEFIQNKCCINFSRYIYMVIQIYEANSFEQI